MFHRTGPAKLWFHRTGPVDRRPGWYVGARSLEASRADVRMPFHANSLACVAVSQDFPSVLCEALPCVGDDLHCLQSLGNLDSFHNLPICDRQFRQF